MPKLLLYYKPISLILVSCDAKWEHCFRKKDKKKGVRCHLDCETLTIFDGILLLEACLSVWIFSLNEMLNTNRVYLKI